MTIDGKVILVTGAGKSIGGAIVLRLTKGGCHIAAFEADVTKRDEVYAAFEHAEKRPSPKPLVRRSDRPTRNLSRAARWAAQTPADVAAFVSFLPRPETS
jgi:NAD(P)-dependent dehydrogenase (short-subunit alcohol dehydrogenase family)